MAPQRPAVVRVRSASFGRAVPRGFIGLSFEYGYVFPYTGTDPGLVNPVLVRLIGNLDPGGGFVLRGRGRQHGLELVADRITPPSPTSSRPSLRGTWSAISRHMCGWPTVGGASSGSTS